MVGQGQYDYGEFMHCFEYPVFALPPGTHGFRTPRGEGLDMTDASIVVVQADWYPPQQLIPADESGFGAPVLVGAPKPADEPLVWARTLHPENIIRVAVDLGSPGRRVALIDLDHRHS